MPRYSDGSAGDADYGVIGSGYATQRRPDPRIEALIWDALGDARTVINVGAGAGSYEPHDRYVTAVEPSASMRAERPASRVPAIDGTADALPFDDDAFDAGMATVTAHQWPDLEACLAELRRVARAGRAADLHARGARAVVDAAVRELFAVEAGRMPPIERIVTALGPGSRAEVVPVPADCIDGFGQAFFARPERTLDREVRRAMSAWSFVEPGVVERNETELARDLASGAWDREWGAFRSYPACDVGLRIIVAR